MTANKRVIGIGGIFFKAENTTALKNWYRDHLGLNNDDYGTMFRSKKADELLQWSPFEAETDYFQPSQKKFMINYRVENLVQLVEILESEGLSFLDEIAVYEYGKFIHLMDPEGNKIELWEPIDSSFLENNESKLT